MMISISCGRAKKVRKPRQPLAVKAGDRVMRKSDRSRRLSVGTVEWVSGDTARVRWPAPHRIGGEFHHSTVKLTSPDLMLATDEAVAERRVDVRLAIVRQEMAHALRFCRVENQGDAAWFERNRTTPDAYLERLCEQLRGRVRNLVRAGRELKQLREG